MSPTVIILAVGILALFIGYGWYASLVRKRNKAREALSGIDVQLRKRFDLIPNILRIAGRFMQHERELMAKITGLRAHALEAYDKNSPET